MATQKKLPSYKGHLSAIQIADGINAAAENARRLIEDAQTILDADRYPSAAALAILSIEESGKISILRGLALVRDDKELVDRWRSYRSHTKKNTGWILPDLVAKGARTLEDFRPMFDELADHPLVLDHIKQIAFYTDCLGNANWSIPSKIIDRELASSLVKIAWVLAHDKRVTPREIELWVEHIGPVWKRDMKWMKSALANWYQAMKQEKLIDEVPNDLENFLKGLIRGEGE